MLEIGLEIGLELGLRGTKLEGVTRIELGLGLGLVSSLG